MYKYEYCEAYGEHFGLRKYHDDMKASRAIKAKMTIDQFIDFLNTPYQGKSETMSVDATKNPMKMRFVGIVHKNEELKQRETTGSRIFRIRNKARMTQAEMVRFVNQYGKDYEIKITLDDLVRYEEFNVTPKHDKLWLIAVAFGVSVDYLSGYGDNDCKSDNFIIDARFNGKGPVSIEYMQEIAARVGVESVG